MPGTRSCVVSAKLAKALDLAEDPDDDEPGEQQLEEHDQVLCEVAAPIWNRLLRRGQVATIFWAVEAGDEWPAILKIAKRLGAEDPPRPKPKARLDVRRVVMEARAQSTGRSSAARSAHLAAAIQEQRAQAARWGREVEINMAAVQAEFIRQGLQAPL